LETAEFLASKVRHVTSAEWRVLGSEYLVDSHFVKAESLFAQAVRVSRNGSLASQAESLQGRAGAAMMQGADGQKRGRDAFREAERLVMGRNDPYSTYMLAHTYRGWAASEFQVGNLTDARDRLMDAVRAVRQIPEWTPAFRAVELSACMQILMALCDRFLALSDLAAARACLDGFAEAIRLDQNEISRDALAQIYWRRAVLESAAGNVAAVEQFRQLARSVVETLPETNATRAALLGGAPAPGAAPTPVAANP
jgi:tetratricopeptide (TPR) repeat protein